MISLREVREIEIMFKNSDVTDGEIIGSMIAFMDLNGILDEYLKGFPEFVKEMKRLKNEED